VIVTERLGDQAFVSSEVGRHEIGRTPLRRLGVPADVGSVAVFLASEEASYMNGTTIILDGGAMAVW
jgi:NAD(P)-dependent dehydrogenase (short-subunit alcohol dehydrogenase family)